MKPYQKFIEALPEDGLFREAGLPFHLSPEPFPLEKKVVKQLERLGPILLKFQMACDRLYKRSKKSSITPWLAEVLDAGKPEWLLEAQASALYKNSLPRVIRPDLLLTDEGLSLTELDSVPGGIGVTSWLSAQYEDVIGEGMLTGFRSIRPEGLEVHISEESADYLPEMRYLTEALNDEYGPHWSCQSAENIENSRDGVYRFFELFDWENIPSIQQLFTEQEVTPPLKPHLEEKLWLALFHTPALKELWEEELRAKQIKALKEIIPYGWVVDPSPLPPYAAIPKLNVHSWDKVGKLSQKERELVLKVSGFSENAWGSRGVTIGHDSSGADWQAAMNKAQEDFSANPYILQEFADTKLVEHAYYDESGELRTMKGRVRLCPYYFVSEDYKEVTLGGVLVTINPADKKKIHGMRDAILTVAMLNEE